MNADFERSWRDRLARNIQVVAGAAIGDQIMVQHATAGSDRDVTDAIAWTAGVMQRMDDLLDKRSRIDVMTACSCRYPRDELQDIRKAYAATGDVGQAHEMLQQKFVRFLKEDLGLEKDHIATILDRGWGLAGVISGSAIIATKIPKSGYLLEYLKEQDPDKKRALYCHCPRVRSMLESRDGRLSATYCYCGAGFYKAIWEEILGHEVQVELQKTVMQGDDVCQFKVVL